jgi:hypothetical protein
MKDVKSISLVVTKLRAALIAFKRYDFFRQEISLARISFTKEPKAGSQQYTLISFIEPTISDMSLTRLSVMRVASPLFQLGLEVII